MFFKKKNHLSEGLFFKNDKMCNSYESRSVSARAESYKKVRKQIFKKNFFTSPCFLGSGIRDGKNPDPGSGINIPDPQHCVYFISPHSQMGVHSTVNRRFISQLVRPISFFFVFRWGAAWSPPGTSSR